MGALASGVKTGVGIWLAFKIIGILGFLCMVTCGVCVFKTGSCISRQAEEAMVEEKEAVAVNSPVGKSVMFLNMCNVRSKPTTNSRVVHKIPANKAFVVLEEQGKWSKIDYAGGLEGWVGCTAKR